MIYRMPSVRRAWVSIAAIIRAIFTLIIALARSAAKMAKGIMYESPWVYANIVVSVSPRNTMILSIQNSVGHSINQERLGSIVKLHGLFFICFCFIYF